MRKFMFAVLAVTAIVAAPQAVAARSCKSQYYTGQDRDLSWRNGRDFAIYKWSTKVRGHLGSRWAHWSKARNSDYYCVWSLPGGHDCRARAQPCK